MTHATPPALALLLLALAPTVDAADCTEADPCILRITLDDTGVWFDAPGDREATVRQHRWYTLDVLNQFNEEHTLSLGNRTLTAPGYDGDGPHSRHGPVPFPEAGSLVLRDATAGATATVQVEAAEPPDPPAPPEDPDPTPGEDDNATREPPPGDPNGDGDPTERRKEVPSLAPPLLAAALALAALAATRPR